MGHEAPHIPQCAEVTARASAVLERVGILRNPYLEALLQGQIEMAIPGAFALTGVVPDADFFQLPALYGRTIEMIHLVVDGAPGKLLARRNGKL